MVNTRSDEARPYSLMPLGALVRKKGTDETGLVVAYIIHHAGPVEYLVKLRSGRVFLPHHQAIPISHPTHPRKGEEKVGKVRRGESESAAIDAASSTKYSEGEES